MELVIGIKISVDLLFYSHHGGTEDTEWVVEKLRVLRASVVNLKN